MVVDSTSQEDVRNVRLAKGFAHVRLGVSVPVTTFTEQFVVAGEPFRAEGAAILVAYNSTSRDVNVYRTTASGAAPSLIAKWFTLDAAADSPPIVFMAEVDGLMFMAHDEPVLTRRAPSVYYDPAVSALKVISPAWAHGTTINPAGAENSLSYHKLASVATVVTVEYVDPPGNNVPLSVAVVGGAITVTLATDAASVVTSTAAQVRTAILANASAAALVSVTIRSDDGGLADGSGVVTAIAATTIATDGIRFRGVAAHLGNYLAGWGYGTEAENRPEYVRMSLPLEPATFELRHYMPAGAKGEPILRCLSGSSGLIVFKPSETWNHVGGDRATFDIYRMDDKHGIHATRLAVSVQGSGLYWWAKRGPRRMVGGGIEDLSIPLELLAPSPADLVAEGVTREAFASYYPPDNEVRFHFGRRVYAFGLETEQWAYHELGFTPFAALLLQPDSAINSSAEAGYVQSLTVTADVEESAGLDRNVTIRHTNVAMVGDETIEYWVKPSGGAWSQSGSQSVAGTTEQSFTYLNLLYGKSHSFQIRARRGAVYRTGYTDADPGVWPAGSALTYATQLEAPANVSISWSRTSSVAEQISVVVTPHYTDVDLELVRSAVVKATAVQPHSGNVTLIDTTITGEANFTFTARHKTADRTGPESAAVTRWAGPLAPTLTAMTDGGSCRQYDVTWTNGDVSAATEVHDNYAGSGTLGPFALRQTEIAGTTYTAVVLDPQSELVTVSAKLRHKATAFTVDDFSDFSTTLSVQINNIC